VYSDSRIEGPLKQNMMKPMIVSTALLLFLILVPRVNQHSNTTTSSDQPVVSQWIEVTNYNPAFTPWDSADISDVAAVCEPTACAQSESSGSNETDLSAKYFAIRFTVL
jgi:hypothetical protein